MDSPVSRIHVDDLCLAMETVLFQPPSSGFPYIFNVVDDIPYTRRQVIDIAAYISLLPKNKSIVEQHIKDLKQNESNRVVSNIRAISNAKLKRVFSWQPQYPSVIDGLASIHLCNSLP